MKFFEDGRPERWKKLLRFFTWKSEVVKGSRQVLYSELHGVSGLKARKSITSREDWRLL